MHNPASPRDVYALGSTNKDLSQASPVKGCHEEQTTSGGVFWAIISTTQGGENTEIEELSLHSIKGASHYQGAKHYASITCQWHAQQGRIQQKMVRSHYIAFYMTLPCMVPGQLPSVTI